MVILTLLAWATQTLFHQWGYGGLILETGPAPAEQDSAPYLPPAPNLTPTLAPNLVPDLTIPLAPALEAPEAPAEPQPLGITLELRSQIRADGTKLTLRDVCRWSDDDRAVMEPVADLVLTRLSDTPGVRRVSVDQIKDVLHDAGMNLSIIRFSGAAACAVYVGDAQTKAPLDVATTRPAGGAAPAAVPVPIVADAPQTPLRDLLLADLHEQLKMSAQQVQVDFDPKDANILALTSPRCRIDFDGTRTAGALGAVAWRVRIQDGTDERTLTINATARAWEDQLVLTRPLSRGQAFLKGDIAPRRVLVEKPTTQPLTADDAVLAQVAARDLKRGDVLTVADVDMPQIVRAGQFMTVGLKVGDATVQTVATALDAGKKGSTIRARNDANGQVYRVRITAPDTGTEISSDDAVSTTGNN
jgi:flagella basal body P-ring formation protein FlgA